MNFMSAFQEYEKNQVHELKETIRNYEAAHSVRNAHYNRAHIHSSSDGLYSFREELMQHLAQNIYVKEHRQRYQQEQLERFSATIGNQSLYKSSMTLAEFSNKYAMMIERLVEASHHFKSPKIEANYNSSDDRTTNPINSTIFYYFFSMEKSKRAWARWFLAASRYPNDRLRAAYMKIFSY